MTEVIYTKSQEEYEDDFEKDLDWLISEESRSEDQVNLAFLLNMICICSFFFGVDNPVFCFFCFVCLFFSCLEFYFTAECDLHVSLTHKTP